MLAIAYSLQVFTRNYYLAISKLNFKILSWSQSLQMNKQMQLVSTVYLSITHIGVNK